ncbi:MAG: chorismate-binding protein [Oligoflexales bacterium]|nr:chorismate-binding protein [Oligoflexales bacterium]
MTDLSKQKSIFMDLAKKNDIVGISRKLTWDHESIITLAQRFLEEEHFFLLESASGGSGHIARYSFLGFDPLFIWQGCQGGALQFSYGHKSTELNCSTPENPVSVLQQSLAKLNVAHILPENYKGPSLDTLSGATGYLAYDIASYVEPSIGKVPPKKLNLPELFYMIPKNMLIFDQLTRSLYLIYYTWTGDHESFEQTSLYEKAEKGIDELEGKLKSHFRPAPTLNLSDDPVDFEAFSGSLSKQEFLNLAKECRQQIMEGEIFQIQIGNRLSGPAKASAFDIFRHLRILNPSPYMFFYKFKDDHILGASPEMMVNVEGDLVTHRPIAGTRKRTWNAISDLKMIEELTSCEKERAEHVMLVDLSRNDVGRIASPGSVKVRELMVVEEFSHVFHLVSEVNGRLRDELTVADALISGFPNGTVSGAPKIRAMQLIYEMEPCAREFYAGSLGMFTFSMDLKSTILIRSIHVRDGIASTQASAGIVYDSIPENEWKETRHKMAACLTAIQNTLPPL